MRNKLVEKRENLGLTQATVAKSVGVSRSFYGLIETGARNPSFGLAKRIASILKEPVTSLFFDLDSFRMKQEGCGIQTQHAVAKDYQVG